MVGAMHWTVRMQTDSHMILERKQPFRSTSPSPPHPPSVHISIPQTAAGVKKGPSYRLIPEMTEGLCQRKGVSDAVCGILNRN